MPAPYDYTIGEIASPQQSFLQGIQMVDALRKREQDMAMAKANAAAAQKKQEFMQGFMGKIAAGTAKPEDYQQALLVDPANEKALTAGLGAMNTARKDTAFSNMAPVFGGLALGTPAGIQAARNALSNQLSAATNAGEKDTASAIEAQLKMLDTPEGQNVLMGQTGIGLNAIDPERFGKLNETVIKQRAAPIAERKALAEAGKAESEQSKAAVEAEFARKERLAALDKAAAELGLSQANKNKVLAETRKLGIETQQAALALESFKTSGGVDPEKKFAQEEKIRKEWQGRNKMYGELQGTFNTLQASANSANGPGDIALITGFMKMLDPGSVVRETEFATARDTAGLFTQLQNRLEKAKNGQLLSPQQRKEYVDLSKKYLDSAQKKAAQEKKDLGIVVKNYKLNPENVFGAEQASTPALPTSATVGGKTYPRPASFTDAQWSDYLKANGVIQ